MAKHSSEKKEKKSKEVTEKVAEEVVTGADVEMEDVEVAKVCIGRTRDQVLLEFTFCFR